MHHVNSTHNTMPVHDHADNAASLTVIQQVSALPYQSLTELRRLWQQVFHTPAPQYPKKALVNPLAYRLQELAYGGISERHARQLHALSKALSKGDTLTPDTKKARTPTLAVGTCLIREYRGISHHVLVTDTGFDYQGKPYRSLSAVAQKITGTKWNGWVFFGLKKK